MVKLHVRNIETGSVEEKSFSSNVTVDEVITSKRKLQFLYNNGKNAVFMDPVSFEQVEIPLVVIGDLQVFLKEGESVDILFWDEKPLSVDLPPKVTLVVSQTDPGVKGNSASNMYKPAELDNGLKLKVPLFIEVGDKIRVDTKNGEYVERVK